MFFVGWNMFLNLNHVNMKKQKKKVPNGWMLGIDWSFKFQFIPSFELHVQNVQEFNIMVSNNVKC